MPLDEQRRTIVAVTKATQQRLSGNYAAQYVAARLAAANCLVRPVAEGTDQGVDLYCEVIDDEQPKRHFWVQVKGGLTRPPTGGHPRITLGGKHLAYWANQPVPVFVIGVEYKWRRGISPPASPNLWFLDLSRKVIERGPKYG